MNFINHQVTQTTDWQRKESTSHINPQAAATKGERHAEIRLNNLIFILWLSQFHESDGVAAGEKHRNTFKIITVRYQIPT